MKKEPTFFIVFFLVTFFVGTAVTFFGCSGENGQIETGRGRDNDQDSDDDPATSGDDDDDNVDTSECDQQCVLIVFAEESDCNHQEYFCLSNCEPDDTSCRESCAEEKENCIDQSLVRVFDCSKNCNGCLEKWILSKGDCEFANYLCGEQCDGNPECLEDCADTLQGCYRDGEDEFTECYDWYDGSCIDNCDYSQCLIDCESEDDWYAVIDCQDHCETDRIECVLGCVG